MAERAPLYSSIADVTVATDGRKVQSVAEEILRGLHITGREGLRAVPTCTLRMSTGGSAAFTTLNVALGERSYPILIGPGLLERTELFDEHIPGQDVPLVSNTTVGPLDSGIVARGLASRRVVEVTLPDGEEHKTLPDDGTHDRRAGRESLWSGLHGRRSRRWRCRRSIRLRCGVLSAGRPLRPDTHDASGAGGFLGRWQDGGQPCRG